MATSIGDLLAALDHETARGAAHDPRDASRALDRTGRLLGHLRNDGIGAESAGIRGDVVRRLADACATAAVAFESGPGRLSDLVGVTSDAVGRLQADLTDSDRWAAAIVLATTARRCAAVIAKSGPYSHVPQLLGVADRSRELMRAAAAYPPDPDHLGGHDLPIPAERLPRGLSPARIAIESMAELVDEFRRGGRAPMNVRQLLGVCHAAEQAATQGAVVAKQLAGVTSPQPWMVAPIAWRNAREVVGLYADQPRRPGWDGSRVLLCAARIEEGVRRTFDGADGRMAEPDLRRAALAGGLRNIAAVIQLLPRLANGCEKELDQIHRTLFVAHGPRPLHEDRVGEWLRHEVFVVRRSDMTAASDALHLAAGASERLANDLRPAARTAERGTVLDGPALAQVPHLG